MDGSTGLTIRDTIISRLDEVGSATSSEMIGWVSNRHADGLAILGRMVANREIKRVGWQPRTGLALWASRTSASTQSQLPDT